MLEPLVLIPGLMLDARIFTPQIAAFSGSRAVQVAAVTRGETIREMAEDVLAAAPGTFALAGLSLGGIVAMEVIRQAPERVTRLALLDTSPLAETPEQAAAREPQIAAATAGRLEEVMRDEMKPRYLAPGPARLEVLNQVMEMAMALGPEVFARQSRALQRRPDAQAVLRGITVPTLVLCGRHDALCPVKRHEHMAALIPGADLQVIEDAGHLPTLEQPGPTNATMGRWLTDTLLLT